MILPTQDGTIVASSTTAPAVVAPLIIATPPPAYMPPVELYIAPDPPEAPAPEYQFRGEGGTPFGARPPAYVTPLYILPPVQGYDLEGYADQFPGSFGNKGAVPGQPLLPGRPGKDQVMPVLTGQQPTKPAVAPPVESVQRPGPITGTVAGFDLSRVPFWAWLAAAAVVGSRLLR